MSLTKIVKRLLNLFTAKGDFLVYDGTNNVIFPVGTDGQSIVADSVQPAGVKWANVTTAPGGTTGDIQYNNAGVFAGDTATTDGSGNIIATSFTGSGAGLTNIPSAGTQGQLQYNNAGVLAGDIANTDGAGNVQVLSLQSQGGDITAHVGGNLIAADGGNVITTTGTFQGDGSGLTNVAGGTAGQLQYNTGTGLPLGGDTATTDGAGNLIVTSISGSGAGLTNIAAAGTTGEFQYNSGGVLAGDSAVTDGSGNWSNIASANITTVVASLFTANAAATFNDLAFFNNSVVINAGILELVAGGITIYNGIFTQGYGVPPIVAANDVTAQTTAQTLATYTNVTTVVTGTYRVGGYVTITAISVDVLQLQVTYTDENSVSRTVSFFPQGLTSASLSATGAYTFPEIVIRAAAAAIAVKVVFTTGIGTVTYDAGGFIEQIT